MRNRIRWRLAIPFSLLALVGLAAWVLMRSPRIHDEPIRQRSGQFTLPSVPEPQSGSVQISTAPFSSSVTTSVIVLDVDGQPIHGAKLLIAKTTERRIPASRPPLAETTSEGEAQLPEGWGPDASAQLLVCARNYIPVGVPAPARGSITTVTLLRGRTQEFRCVDQLDQPLSGIRIVLSRVAPDNAEEDMAETPIGDKWLPGPDAMTRMYHGTSDSNGIVVVSDLEESEYQCDVVASTLIPVRDDPALLVLAGSPPVDIVLMVPVGFVLGLMDEPIIDYAIQGFAGSELPGTRWHLGMLSERLKKRFPGMAVSLNAQGSSRPQECRVTLFADAYYGTAMVLPWPMAEPIEPIRLDWTGLRDVRRTGHLTVEIGTPDGAEHAGTALLVRTKDLGGQYTFDIVSSRPSPLPAGTYSLSSRWFTFPKDPGPILITEGRSTIVRIVVDGIPQRCRLDLIAPSSVPICQSAVIITSDKSKPIYTGGRSPIEFFVPAFANATIRAHAFGFAEQAQVFKIDPANALDGVLSLEMIMR